MIVRILKPEEGWKASLVQAVAFEFGIDIEKRKAECAQVQPKEAYAGSLPHDDRSPLKWAALSEDEEIYGCVGVTAYPVRFDGHAVLMGGIGGVASLPQHRRHGAIRGCMQAALADMYENGYVLSSLYPFSTAYYRKFGYEVGGNAVTWTVDMAAMNLPEAGGSMEMVLPGDDLADVNHVYGLYTERWNSCAIREDFDAELRKANWLEQKRYLYIWRNDAGEARGSILFTKKDGVMDCMTNFGMENHLMFADMQALAALLKFARAFAADYRAIRFTLPECVRIDGLIAEHNKVQREVNFNAMHRFVNVRRALELCRCRGEGVLRIAVTDPMLPQNCAVWQVSYGTDGANTVERTEEQPDIVLPVGSLTQLLLGVRTAEDLPMMPEVRVENPEAAFGDMFYAKPVRLLELF